MEPPICACCGTQHAIAMFDPEHCSICVDERQYVPKDGQAWTTHGSLLKRHRSRIEMDDGLLGFGTAPDFAINQRAIYLPTGAGNLLWECVSIVTEEALDRLKMLGGVDALVISHPHFYSSMVEWSEALGGVPILLHEADRQWVKRPSQSIEFWGGDKLCLSSDVTLLRFGGHFPGSTGLHWAREGETRNALFPGDAMQVVADRRHVSFMYSYPNYIPMNAADVLAMQILLEDYEFEDVYGYTWGRNIVGYAKTCVDDSFERYLKILLSQPFRTLERHV